MQIRVYYEDTDAGGVVYHSNYLNFCERARSEFFFTKGFSPIIDDAHFVVRKIDCDFLSPALFGDTLFVKTNILNMKNASLTLSQEITRENKVIFKATIMLVLVKNSKVQKINKDIKTFLNSVFIQ